MGIHAAITADDRARIRTALNNPNRKDAIDPLDPRLECTIGRTRTKGQISEAEYNAGVKWRTTHSAYMHSIMSPDDLSDDDCEKARKAYERGMKILEANGKRVLHAVNAIAVFDEPEELGDFEYTLTAARIGLSALATSF